MRARFLTAPTLSFLETISVPHNQWQPAVSNTMHCLRSEEHTSELQSRSDLVCRLLLEKKKNIRTIVMKSDMLHERADQLQYPYFCLIRLLHLARELSIVSKERHDLPALPCSSADMVTHVS